MTKAIGMIGNSNASTEAIEAMLKAKGIDDVILVPAGEQLSDEIVPELPRGVTFRLEAPPELITKSNYQEIKDGRTLRRERRKRNRLNKR